MRPNILFIMSDDHAAQAISCYGHGINRTPNLDRIASEGMRLDNCYVTNSICTPSRASILCGTYNHVNLVTTLDTHLDNRLPNVAKILSRSGYQTALFGKWHLGEGKAHEPAGFDEWSVLPGQGEYFDPIMINRHGSQRIEGYVTDIVTDSCLEFLKERDVSRPFFMMCHHKAPHRNFQCHPKYQTLFEGEDLPLPATYGDDYSNRAQAAKSARMRIRSDTTYSDLGLVQPERGMEAGEPMAISRLGRSIPDLSDGGSITLIDVETGEKFFFNDPQALAEFKYQRYMKRYLRTVASIDENVGRLLDYLDDAGLADNTIVIYTSDQGFFLGEHGWFDKRFMYEESLKMPFLVRYPNGIAAGQTSSRITTNVDFAPTFLDYVGVTVPTFMQGTSMRTVLEGSAGTEWQDVAYHRYWMHKDSTHNAFAHYGIRGTRYKLIYWYNDPLSQPGAFAGDEPPEWELFDCETDPHELSNRADDPAYAHVFGDMLRKLDAKMAEIGDLPEHDTAQVLKELANA